MEEQWEEVQIHRMEGVLLAEWVHLDRLGKMVVGDNLLEDSHLEVLDVHRICLDLQTTNYNTELEQPDD